MAVLLVSVNGWGADNVIFSEPFDGFGNTGGNDGSWSGSVASATIPASYTEAGWTFERGNAGKDCLKLGTTTVLGSAQTPELSNLSGNATLVFKAGAWAGDSEQLTLTISGGGSLSASSVALVRSAWTIYSVNIIGGTASTQITFQGYKAGNSRFFLDSVVVFTSDASPTPTATPSKTSLAFGEKEIGTSPILEFTVTPQNLTGDLTIAASTITGGSDVFDVDVKSIAQDATGAQTITVTFTPAAETAYTGKVTISGGGLTAAVEVTLTGTGVSASVLVPALYGLVTNVNQLEAGGRYLIVGKKGDIYYALGYQNTSSSTLTNRPGVEVTTINETTLSTGVAESKSEQTLPYELTLGGSTDLWTLEDAVNGQKIGPASSDNNYLRLSETSPIFTIAIAADGKATITCVGDESNSNGRNTIRFYTASTLFACYASGQSDVYLYKLGLTTAATPTATLSVPSLEFGEVISGTSFPLTFTVTPQNLIGDLTIAASTITGGSDVFDVDVKSIAQDATGAQTITVTFTPAAETDYTGKVTISGGGLLANEEVALTGTGISALAPSINATPTVLAFGNHYVDKTSDGDTVTVTAANLTGALAHSLYAAAGSKFSITEHADWSTAAGGKLVVKFTPTAIGEVIDTLYIKSEGDNITKKVVLKGTGIVPQLTADSAQVRFGKVNISKTIGVIINAAHLKSGVTLNITGDDAALFAIDSAALAKPDNGTLSNKEVKVTFAPQNADKQVYTALLTIASADVDDVSIPLTGSAIEPALYGLVTKASQLAAGGKYLIVGKKADAYYALGWQNTNNRPGAEVTIDGTALLTGVANVASEKTLPYELTLGGSPDLWTLEDAVTGGKIGPSKGTGNGNLLHLSDNEPTFTIAIAADGKATIICVGAESNTNESPRNTIRFNTGNTLFACYANGQSDVYLYKLGLVTAATPTATPAAGNYEGAQSVTLATTTADAAIHYTTDNWTTSHIYSAAINIAAATTIKAYAAAAGMDNSDTLRVDYTFVAAVTVAPLSHNFGVATLGGDAKTFTITLSNAVNLTGGLTAAIAPDTAPGVFTILPYTLTQGNGELQVRFAPTAAGNYGDTLVISGGGIEPVKVRLFGSASAPYLKFNAGSRNIYNVGSVAINFSAHVLEDVAITSSNPAFAINKTSSLKSKTRDTIVVSIAAATTDSALIRIVSGTLRDSLWIKPAMAPVGWAFTSAGTTTKATTGLNGNSGNVTISTTAGNFGYTNNGISANTWEADKHWETSAIDAYSFEKLKLQYSTQGSATGPKNWKVQYKIGTGGQWQDLGEPSIAEAATAYTYSFDLPAACNSANELFIRWAVKDNVSINGGTIGTTGSNYLQDIYLTAAVSTSPTEPPIITPDPAEYTVTITPPTNGTLSVKVGSTNVTSGNRYPAGTALTITAIADNGYNLDAITANDTQIEGNTYTLSNTDVTIAAVFVAVVPTGVETENVAHLQIYPTITTGQLTIWNAGNKIEIYNMNGSLIGIYNVAIGTTAINIAHLPAGTYIVRAGGKMAKIVKQ
ncbi:hypothetical protein FACS1894156_1480 [Bacteroidia bacterium]|nr:hypothetical protein FACS1894156_1480 [Bacteroidia bacterium]